MREKGERDSVSVASENHDGEMRNGRLQLFLSSAFDTFWSSLEGVFGSHSNNHEETQLEEAMSSRAVVSEQHRGGGGKQKNGNRRVLRDIGNIEGGNNKCKLAAKKAAEGENVRGKKDDVRIKKVKGDEESIKKRSKTLTSILTARSKAAHKDIDAADVDDELAAVDYVEDIYNFYKQTEEHGRVHDYMPSQPQITPNMRAILVDWLIQVHHKFDFMPETLYLTINILDRFLSLKTVSTPDLQLVGLTSMLIACKYEEIWAPEVGELIKISDNPAYVRERVLAMEKSILGKLEWYLTVPTPYVFLVRYVKAAAAAAAGDKEMESMAFFYAEVGLMSYSTVVRYSPSQLSAAAVYAARCTLDRNPFWTRTLQHYTAYSEDRLMECAESLVNLATEKKKLKAVYRKYSNPDRQAVALFPPPQF